MSGEGWSAPHDTPGVHAGMLTRAAAGWDVFFLCPDKALAGFENAATKGSAIAAYNAALMRLERSLEGDRAAAISLLERAAMLGDATSRALLNVERGQQAGR